MKVFRIWILMFILLGVLATNTLTIPRVAANNSEQWHTVPVPGAWEDAGVHELAAHDGFVWYRAVIRVPQRWEGRRLLFTALRIDNVDEAYFNGQRVGSNGSMPPLYGGPASAARRPYVIDPELVRFGEYNLLAIRVYDDGGEGGLVNGPFQLAAGNEAIDLSGLWQVRAGDRQSFGQWTDADDDASRKDDIEAFMTATGDKRAGHNGIVPVDMESRRRAIESIRDAYRNNQNPHARTDDKGEPLPPKEAHAALQPAVGLAIDLVAHEPTVSQPIYVQFDERGRMWVVQYRQYPNPAGLEVIAWDQHLRKIFDVDKPPPPYVGENAKYRGDDRITIHEDTDGDGQYDKVKTFVEGLNLTTSVAFDKDGVWVLSPPHLLFYPDKNHDDVPDGDPVVHLSGFHLEDTHSIANSLKWGPDGWLYGGTGSTTTARVVTHLNSDNPPLRFYGQNVWRYHPTKHKFELFSQGGWNTFGVDFDDKGRVYSGTNAGLRVVLFPQDSFLQKGFGKHGPHTNPYAFDVLGGLPYRGDETRVVQQWEPYSGGAIPSLKGQFIGANPLAHWIIAVDSKPNGSYHDTWEVRKVVSSKDQWFRPVHSTTGPDGAIYFSDWYDARITHLDPRDNWDKERGRIYRLRSVEHKYAKPFDLRNHSSRKLVQLLHHQNRWHRTTARRVLAERHDKSALPLLKDMFRQTNDGQASLEALWAIHAMAGLDQSMGMTGLKHPDANVRLWTVRLLGDPKRTVDSTLLNAMVDMASNDANGEVIQQLCSTAQRLPAAQARPLITVLLARDDWASDQYVIAQLWWAVERLYTEAPDEVMDMMSDESLWSHKSMQTRIIDHLGRRMTTELTDANLVRAAILLNTAPSAGARSQLLQGMERGLQGNVVAAVPAEMDDALNTLWHREKPDAALIRFALRLNSKAAFAAAMSFVRDISNPTATRIELMNTLVDTGREPVSALLINLLDDSNIEIKRSAISGLRVFSDPKIADALLTRYTPWDATLRRTAQSVLSSRPTWSLAMLQAVDAGKISRESIAVENLLAIQSRADDKTKAIISKHWGNLRQSDTQRADSMKRIHTILEAGPGDATAGKTIFADNCARCHKLFDEGRDIGPELTGYERGNLEFLIPSIVDPSLALREEYERVDVTLKLSEDDYEQAIITGFVVGGNPQTVTVKDLEGNILQISRDHIENMDTSKVSVMPEGLLDAYNETEIRDLFAYLQSNPPKATP